LWESIDNDQARLGVHHHFSFELKKSSSTHAQDLHSLLLTASSPVEQIFFQLGDSILPEQYLGTVKLSDHFILNEHQKRPDVGMLPCSRLSLISEKGVKFERLVLELRILRKEQVIEDIVHTLIKHSDQHTYLESGETLGQVINVSPSKLAVLIHIVPSLVVHSSRGALCREITKT
jgi:hypothetical protein